MPSTDLVKRLKIALADRMERLDSQHNTALRLFAGFYEGLPELVADLYARTLVLFDFSKEQQSGEETLVHAQDFYLANLPWIECVIQKTRQTHNDQLRRGLVTFGDTPASQITEHGINYYIDLSLNQDTSFYLDTRNLRAWLRTHANRWHVLNLFAYTGSLGVAALFGNAARVIQSDRSKKFLEIARQSAIRNRLDLGKMKLHNIDFFNEVSQRKRSGDLFDCVILDPPIYANTAKGTVDLLNQSTRLINKVRPLVKHGGWLVAINNALFLSGKDYMRSLEILSQDGYLTIEKIIPIPQDITGFPETIVDLPPTDPAPFNHPTKIAILGIKRKA